MHRWRGSGCGRQRGTGEDRSLEVGVVAGVRALQITKAHVKALNKIPRRVRVDWARISHGLETDLNSF